MVKRSRIPDQFISELTKVIRAYCLGSATSFDVDRLVSMSTNLVEARLSGRLRVAARVQECSVAQMATSVISGLFTKNGKESPLAQALSEAGDLDDKSLIIRFRGIVTRHASQEMFHRWKEYDPVSARLWRNLRRVLRHDKRFVAFPVDAPRWVTLRDTTEFGANQAPASHDDLVRIISSQEVPSESLAESVHSVISRVTGTTDLQNVVQVELLFSALRETRSEAMARQFAEEVASVDTDPVLSIAVDRASRLALESAGARLDRYRSAGKLNQDLVEVFSLALSDLLADCADGGPSMSYYDYLHARKPNLTLEDYRQTLRIRFEYLAEAVKLDFVTAMKEYFLQNRSLHG